VVSNVTRIFDETAPIRHAHFNSAGPPVYVFGFSAGSYTGMHVYRTLIEFEPQLGVRYSKGSLGAVAVRPILFYDFHLNDGMPPLSTTASYRLSQASGLPRPLLVHCYDDSWRLWKPSDEEARDVRSLG
jgi:hypothetical protein